MGFEFDGSIDDFVSTVRAIRNVYPKEVKKFMQSEGNKLKRLTLKTAKSSVKQKTGNYFEGIKRGKYYRHAASGADSIRVYIGPPANHGHLLEQGHEMVTHSGKSTGRYVHGFYIFKKAEDTFKSTYDNDCEKFADQITEPLNKG